MTNLDLDLNALAALNSEATPAASAAPAPVEEAEASATWDQGLDSLRSANEAIRPGFDATLGFTDAIKEFRIGDVLPFRRTWREAQDARRLHRMAQQLELDVKPSDEDEAWAGEYLERAATPRDQGYLYGTILAQAPGFILEYLLTGPGGSMGRAAGGAAAVGATRAASRVLGASVRRRIEREIGEQTLRHATLEAAKASGTKLARLAERAAGGIGGFVGEAAARTAQAGAVDALFGGGMVSLEAYRQATKGALGLREGEDGELAVYLAGSTEDFLEALPEGVLGAFIEYGSESLGGSFAAAGGAMARGGRRAVQAAGARLPKIVPIIDKARAAQLAVAKWWVTKTGKSAADLKKVLDTAGWHGLIGEYLEERSADVARAAGGLDEFRGLDTFFPGVDQTLTELAAFATIGGGIAAVSRGYDALDREMRQPIPDQGGGLSGRARRTVDRAAASVSGWGRRVLADEEAKLAAEFESMVETSAGKTRVAAVDDEQRARDIELYASGLPADATVQQVEASTRGQKAAVALANRLGYELSLVRSSKPGPQGSFSGTRGHIVANVDAVVPLVAVVLHELTHGFRSLVGEAELGRLRGKMDKVAPGIIGRAMKAYAADYDAAARKSPGLKPLTPDAEREEGTAHAVEWFGPVVAYLGTETGRNDLATIAKGDPGVVRRILDALSNMVRRVFRATPRGWTSARRRASKALQFTQALAARGQQELTDQEVAQIAQVIDAAFTGAVALKTGSAMHRPEGTAPPKRRPRTKPEAPAAAPAPGPAERKESNSERMVREAREAEQKRMAERQAPQGQAGTPQPQAEAQASEPGSGANEGKPPEPAASEKPEAASSAPEAPAAAQVDERFDEAVEAVLKYGRASISLVQRSLGVGFARASRLLDQMAERGIVGPQVGKAPREILVTLEDWRGTAGGAQPAAAPETAPESSDVGTDAPETAPAAPPEPFRSDVGTETDGTETEPAELEDEEVDAEEDATPYRAWTPTLEELAAIVPGETTEAGVDAALDRAYAAGGASAVTQVARMLAARLVERPATVTQTEGPYKIHSFADGLEVTPNLVAMLERRGRTKKEQVEALGQDLAMAHHNTRVVAVQLQRDRGIEVTPEEAVHLRAVESMLDELVDLPIGAPVDGEVFSALKVRPDPAPWWDAEEHARLVRTLDPRDRRFPTLTESFIRGGLSRDQWDQFFAPLLELVADTRRIASGYRRFRPEVTPTERDLTDPFNPPTPADGEFVFTTGEEAARDALYLARSTEELPIEEGLEKAPRFAAAAGGSNLEERHARRLIEMALSDGARTWDAVARTISRLEADRLRGSVVERAFHALLDEGEIQVAMTVPRVLRLTPGGSFLRAEARRREHNAVAGAKITGGKKAGWKIVSSGVAFEVDGLVTWPTKAEAEAARQKLYTATRERADQEWSEDRRRRFDENTRPDALMEFQRIDTALKDPESWEKDVRWIDFLQEPSVVDPPRNRVPLERMEPERRQEMEAAEAYPFTVTVEAARRDLIDALRELGLSTWNGLVRRVTRGRRDAGDIADSPLEAAFLDLANRGLIDGASTHRQLWLRARPGAEAELELGYDPSSSPAATAPEAGPITSAGAPAAPAPVKVAERRRRAEIDTTTPAATPALEGPDATMRLADGRSVPAVYALVEADELIPSHDARAGFRKNAAGDINERPYEDVVEGAASRATVERIATHPEPALIFNTTPTAIDGPPIVRESGVVLGGNARSMGMQLAYARGGGPAAALRSAAIAFAGQVGLSREEAAAMTAPVVVRMIAERAAGARGELSRVLNESLTTARSVAADATSRGSRLTVEGAVEIARLVATGTLADTWTTKADVDRLLAPLMRDGVFSDADLVRMREPNGLLTAGAKEQIERALLGAVVRDVRLVSGMRPAIRAKVVRALPSLVSTVTLWPEFEPILAHAIEAVGEAQAIGGSVADAYAQTSLVPQEWRADREALALGSRLLEETSSMFSTRGAILVTELRRALDPQADLFASMEPPRSRLEVYRDVMALERGTGGGTMFSVAPAEPPAIPWRIYHGSSWVWRRPDLAKVGKGEGTAWEGWGFYAAGLENVARFYGEMGSDGGGVSLEWVGARPHDAAHTMIESELRQGDFNEFAGSNWKYAPENLTDLIDQVNTIRTDAEEAQEERDFEAAQRLDAEASAAERKLSNTILSSYMQALDEEVQHRVESIEREKRRARNNAKREVVEQRVRARLEELGFPAMLKTAERAVAGSGGSMYIRPDMDQNLEWVRPAAIALEIWNQVQREFADERVRNLFVNTRDGRTLTRKDIEEFGGQRLTGDPRELDGRVHLYGMPADWWKRSSTPIEAAGIDLLVAVDTVTDVAITARSFQNPLHHLQGAWVTQVALTDPARAKSREIAQEELDRWITKEIENLVLWRDNYVRVLENLAKTVLAGGYMRLKRRPRGNLYEIDAKVSREKFGAWDWPFERQEPHVQRAMIELTVASASIPKRLREEVVEQLVRDAPKAAGRQEARILRAQRVYAAAIRRVERDLAELGIGLYPVSSRHLEAWHGEFLTPNQLGGADPMEGIHGNDLVNLISDVRSEANDRFGEERTLTVSRIETFGQWFLQSVPAEDLLIDLNRQLRQQSNEAGQVLLSAWRAGVRRPEVERVIRSARRLFMHDQRVRAEIAARRRATGPSEVVMSVLASNFGLVSELESPAAFSSSSSFGDWYHGILVDRLNAAGAGGYSPDEVQMANDQWAYAAKRKLSKQLAARGVVGIQYFNSGERREAADTPGRAADVPKSKLNFVFFNVDDLEVVERTWWSPMPANDGRQQLVALHNLTGEGLAFAAGMGGLPVPSMAVRREGLNPLSGYGFGEISLVGTPDLGKPAPGVRVFERDAYSLRFPTVMNPPRKYEDAKKRLAALSLEAPLARWGKHISDIYGLGSTWGHPKMRDAIGQLRSDTALRAALWDALGQPPRRFQRRRPSRYGSIVDQPEVRSLVNEFERLARTPIEEQTPLDVAAIEQLVAAVDRTERDAVGERGALEPAMAERLARQRREQFFERDDEGRHRPHFGTWDRIASEVIDRMRNGEHELDVRRISDVLDKRDERPWLEFAERVAAAVLREPHIVLGNGRKVRLDVDTVVAEKLRGMDPRAQEEGVTFGPGAVRAAAAREATDVDELRRFAAERQLDEPAQAEQEAELEAAVTALKEAALADMQSDADVWDLLNGVFRAAAVVASSGRWDKARSIVREAGGRMTGPVEDAMRLVVKLSADAPSRYAEAIIARHVPLEEFAGAVVPAKDKASIDLLRARGVAVETYRAGGREAAMRRLLERLRDQGQDVRFSVGPQRLIELSRKHVAENRGRWVHNLRLWFHDLKVDIWKMQGEYDVAEGSVEDYHGSLDLALSKTKYLRAEFQEKVRALLEPMRGRATFQAIQEMFAARTSLDRNEWMAYDRKVENGSGITSLEAAAIFQLHREAIGPEIVDTALERLAEINRERLDHLVASSLMTPEKASRWHRREPYWLSLAELEPEVHESLEKWQPALRSMQVKGPLWIAAEGRMTLAVDAFLAWAEDHHIRIEQAEVNNAHATAGVELAALIEEELGEYNEGPARDAWGENQTEIDGDHAPVSTDHPVRLIRVPTQQEREEMAEEGKFFSMPRGAVQFFLEGEQHALVFKDEQLAALLKGLHGKQLGIVLASLRKITGFFSRGVTAREPRFWIKNFMRDSFGASMVLMAEEGIEVAGDVLRRAWWWAPRLVKTHVAAMRGAEVDPDLLARIERAQRAGVVTTWADQFRNVEEARKHLTDFVEGKGADPLKWFRSWFAMLEAFSERFELATRLATFEHALENGATEKEAALKAKRITVNFDQRGTYTPELQALWSFVNPNIQGSVRMGKAFARGKYGRRVIGGALALGFMNELLGFLFSGDDDESGLPRWSMVPEYERDSFLVFPIGLGGTHVKLVLPYGAASIVAAGRRLAHVAAFGQLDPVYDISRVPGEIVRGILTEWSPQDLFATNLITGLVPTPLKPIAEISSNTVFGGRPLRPAANAFGRTLPESARYHTTLDDRLSGHIARGVANVLNLFGPEELPTGLDVSPEVVQRVLEEVMAYVGGGLRDLDKASQFALSKREGRVAWVPFVNDVVTQSTDYHISATFYRLRDRAAQMSSALDGADREQRRVVERYDPAMFRAIQAFERASSRTADLRRAIRETDSLARQRELRDAITKEQARAIRRYVRVRTE